MSPGSSYMDQEVIGTDKDVIAKFDATIRQMARRFAWHRCLASDLVQIGRIALLGCAKRWRERMGQHTSKFSTYAFMRIRGAMISHSMLESRRTEVETAGGESVAPKALIDPEEALLLGRASDAVTGDEATLLRLHLDGEDVRAIAGVTGRSKSAVHRTLSSTIEKLRSCA